MTSARIRRRARTRALRASSTSRTACGRRATRGARTRCRAVATASARTARTRAAASRTAIAATTFAMQARRAPPVPATAIATAEVLAAVAGPIVGTAPVTLARPVTPARRTVQADWMGVESAVMGSAATRRPAEPVTRTANSATPVHQVTLRGASTAHRIVATAILATALIMAVKCAEAMTSLVLASHACSTWTAQACISVSPGPASQARIATTSTSIAMRSMAGLAISVRTRAFVEVTQQYSLGDRPTLSVYWA
jgi:hypothetical protein